MRRKDGRIEPGQSLRGAISARAWNRAQDAADVVLGGRPGVMAEASAALPGSLVVPCLVTTTVADVMPGHVVEITDADGRFPNLLREQPDEPDAFAPQALRLKGRVSVVRQFNGSSFSSPDFNAFRSAYQIPVGVIVGGASMPTPDQPETVNVCIAGVCVARVRSYSTFTLPRFVQPAFNRVPSDTSTNLAGTFEPVDTGTHRLLHLIQGIYVVDDQVVQDGETWRTRVTWGVVLL